jgi:hypothetical protein
MQQIDKAAKILDMRGDAPAAIKVLEGILHDPGIQYYPAFELETLVFLAGIHLEAGKTGEARRYVAQADRLDLNAMIGEEVRACIYRFKRIKKAIDQIDANV